MLHPIGVGTAKSQYLQFAVLVLTARYGSDLCRPNIESDNYWLLKIHSLVYFFQLFLIG
jgi:hypothetical protein